MEVNQKLVMYKHKAGYVPHHETHVAHSRRRYCLTGISSTNPNPVPFDPSLWLVHYCAADPQDRIPVNGIPISRQTANSLSQRASFQQHGQLSRNEFMLHDRMRWPTVNLPPNVNLAPTVNVSPGNTAHPAQQIAYSSAAMSHPGQNQQQQFTQQPQGRVNQGNDDVPSNFRDRSRKLRARLEARAAAKAAASAVPAPTVADEEEGEPMDFLTPRDISSNRYKQHQEWMEEIFNSPYATSKIIPGEIGLGRKGEIEAIIKDFFKVHLSPDPESASNTGLSGSGKLGPEKKVAIRKAFAAYMAEQDAEIEQMRQEHARDIARMELSRRLGALEREMRTAPLYADNHDVSYCIFDCSTGLCGHNFSTTDLPRRTVDEIVKEAEELLGMKLEENRDEVIILDRGGLEEGWAAAHGYGTGSSSRKSDIQQGRSATVTVQQDPSPKARGSSMDQHPPTSQDANQDQPSVSELLANTQAAGGEDVAMGEVPDSSEGKHSSGSDWAIIEHGDASTDSHNQDNGGLDSFVNITGNNEPQGPGESLNTAGETFDGFMPNTGAGSAPEGFVGNEFNAPIDFGNLDSGGEALAGYGDLGLDESAFGAAFHGTSTNPTEQHNMDEP
jgi:hypothetical protein